MSAGIFSRSTFSCLAHKSMGAIFVNAHVVLHEDADGEMTALITQNP